MGYHLSISLKDYPVGKQKKEHNKYLYSFLFVVDPSGLEPELFWTKTRRVANYTTGQSLVVFLLKTVQKYKFFSFCCGLTFFFRF